MKPEKSDRRFAERLLVSLGRLLPGEVRRRIFEPAYFDLLREHVADGARKQTRWSLSLGAARLLIGSMGCGLAHVALNRRTIKRFLVGAGVVTALIAIVSAILLRAWIGQFLSY